MAFETQETGKPIQDFAMEPLDFAMEAKKRARRPRQPILCPMCGHPKPRTRKNKPRGVKCRQLKPRVRKNKPRGLKCGQTKPRIRKNKPRGVKCRHPKPRVRKNKPRGVKCRQLKPRVRKNKPRGVKCGQTKPRIRKNKPRGQTKPRIRKNKPRGVKCRHPKPRVRKNKPHGLKCGQTKQRIRKNKPRGLKHRKKVCQQKKRIVHRPCCNDDLEATNNAEEVPLDYGFDNFFALMKETYNADVDEEDAKSAWKYLPEQDKRTFLNESRSPSELQIVSYWATTLPAGWEKKRQEKKEKKSK